MKFASLTQLASGFGSLRPGLSLTNLAHFSTTSSRCIVGSDVLRYTVFLSPVPRKVGRRLRIYATQLIMHSLICGMGRSSSKDGIPHVICQETAVKRILFGLAAVLLLAMPATAQVGVSLGGHGVRLHLGDSPGHHGRSYRDHDHHDDGHHFSRHRDRDRDFDRPRRRDRDFDRPRRRDRNRGDHVIHLH
jgi:hypothetical protein